MQQNQNEYNTDLKVKWKENIKWSAFSLFFLLMTSFGIASVMFSRVSARKQEIGIRVAVGCTMKDIYKIFIGETVMVVMLSAILVGIYSLFTINSRIVNGGVINEYYVYLIIICIAIVFSLLICIAPVFIIITGLSRLQPRELIGGRE